MRYLENFTGFDKKWHFDFYKKDWEKCLPKEMTLIYSDGTHDFTLGNVMLNGDLVEVTYEHKLRDKWGSPDTLEFDFYFIEDVKENNTKINVDITYGDYMACEFSIKAPNQVSVIQQTSYHSKFDRDGDVFALSDNSIGELVNFFNRLPGIKLTRNDLRFLDRFDNYP